MRINPFKKLQILFTVLVLCFFSCSENTPFIEQWAEFEMDFTSPIDYKNPYTDVEFWVDFTHSNGTIITRPGFWDGKNNWKVRFASPFKEGVWTFQTMSSNMEDPGLHNIQGSLRCTSYKGNNALVKHGLLRMSPEHRNVVHADGTPFLMIADTPWALPWRGTYESVTTYANNREEKNFNTVLLMSLQPDRDAIGPRDRTKAKGFDVAFEDLREGHLNEINIAYYQYFDSLINILISHEIVPVYQPVFHGFGWKGKNVLGWNLDPTEYARYCRYLVARYGAQPAMYLVGADSDGRNIGIAEGGMEIEKWDAYKQPTGLHYSPFDDVVPDWMDADADYIPHENKTYQDADWLDFQWAQTGHGGEHITRKVSAMYENKPTKAVSNGEPTYEGIRNKENGSGWWQGNEAWLQYTNGGTMGVVYGAGGLWNWKLFSDEEGWPEWADSEVSWKQALDLPGSEYVGFLEKALEGLNTTDIEKHPELAEGKLCLAKPGELYIIYLPEGGNVKVKELPESHKAKWFDPIQGEFISAGSADGPDFQSPLKGPSVLIIQR